MTTAVFVTRQIPENGLSLLKEKGYRVDVYPKDNVPTQKDLLRYLKKYPYDAVLCLLTDKIDSTFFDAVPTVRLIASYTVGYDNIDLIAAKKRDITVTNTGGTSQIPVAEQALALMLGLVTRMVEADDFVRKGKYKGWSPLSFIAPGISGATIGLIGTGAIGNEVARMVHQGFGAHILYVDPIQNEHIEKAYGATRCSSVEDLVQRADIVSLHVPLTKQTHHLINRDRLAMMKSTSFIINTSRGAVIDETALVAALKNRTIGGAGLDVFEYEPLLTKGLAALPNVIVTPHIASARQSIREAMAKSAAENIIDFFEGREPQHIIHI